MTPSASLLAAISMPDLSPYLTKGAVLTDGVLLRPADMHTWLLLGGGGLLILGGLALVKVMYSRVKFFALEYGKGRFSVTLPYILAGTVLMVAGVAGAWLGWQALGYSLKLDSTGLTERWNGGSAHYAWEDAESASERIKATDFWISFVKDGRTCRVRFQQRYIGEAAQDKAIAITEGSLIASKTRRVSEETPGL